MTSHARVLNHTSTSLPGMIPDEAELTANVRIVPGRRYGFFTDTSLCIGCKACEVACKEWNLLPSDNFELSGMSYDNTRALSSVTWRHVAFIETDPGPKAEAHAFQSGWLMMSDVCKHCRRAGCLEACPTGALFRTEFDTVVVQQDVCNGCGYCVPACPFGVVELNLNDGRAHKCTLCYDRLKGGLEPACAKSCPTNSIQFGEVEELYERARRRVEVLHALGAENACLYGVPAGGDGAAAPGATGGIEALHAFFLLLDRPEVYNLPAAPALPQKRTWTGLRTGAITMFGLALAAVACLGRGASDRKRGGQR